MGSPGVGPIQGVPYSGPLERGPFRVCRGGGPLEAVSNSVSLGDPLEGVPRRGTHGGDALGRIPLRGSPAGPD
jgi:hypothetical protein